MNTNEISGERALQFVHGFDYIREAGTDGERRAADEIVSAVRQLGVVPAVEEFRIPVQTAEQVIFRITEPFEKEYPAGAFLRGANTPDNGLTAPFLYAENGDDISLKNAKDRIVLVNGPLKPELYEKLNAAGAMAFLTVTGTPVDEDIDRIPGAARLYRGAPQGIPGAVLHIRDAAEIVERSASEAYFRTVQHAGEAVSRNIVCRIPGTVDETLTLTAHYDSVPAGIGAYDNMAACGILYALLACFMNRPAKRTLEFVFLGAEEKGLCGSRAYCETHAAELPKHRFNMNVDLAGQTIGGNVFGVTADPCVDKILYAIANRTGIGVTVRNAIWSSDSNTFAAHGIPAMTLNRDGFGMHTRFDTLDHLSAWSMERSAKLLGAVATELANADVFPFERAVPEEYLSQLNNGK